MVGDGDEEGSSKVISYYRPCRDAILSVLKAKTDNLSDTKNFDRFEHLVRGLGRDGLLEAGVDEAIVAAARSKAAAEHIAQYITPELLATLLSSYE